MKKALVGSLLVALFVGALGLIYFFKTERELDIFDISWFDEDEPEDF